MATATDVGSMSVDECRDYLAEKAGWVPFPPDEEGEVYWHMKGDGCAPLNGVPHPFVESLDGAAEALPLEGCTYVAISYDAQKETHRRWCGQAFFATGQATVEAHDRITAEYRLAVKCHMANG